MRGMSGTAIQRLINCLRAEGRTEARILKLLDYITKTVKKYSQLPFVFL